jgi:ATP-dependent Clp protease ATP-binding subunit ClpC
MFERFSTMARRAIVLAQEEARLLNHNYIGTEHILLGLLHERDGAAARALGSLNVSLDAARDLVREMIGEGPRAPSGHIPFTPRAKKVLELSLREAMSLRSETIGTEHLLLGLIAEGDGVGAQILQRLGVPAGSVRETVIVLASAEPEAAAPAEDPAEDPVERPLSATWPPRSSRIRIVALDEVRDLLKSIDRRLSAIERHLGIEPEAEPEPEADPPAAAE